MPNIPPLNPIAKFLLRRYKEKVISLNPDYSTEASRIVDCIDFIFEAENEVRRG